jgi:hypothetical protein
MGRVRLAGPLFQIIFLAGYQNSTTIAFSTRALRIVRIRNHAVAHRLTEIFHSESAAFTGRCPV